MPALHQTKALLGLLGWRRQIGPASAFLFCRSSNKEVPKYGKSWQPGENHPVIDLTFFEELVSYNRETGGGRGDGGVCG